MRLHRRHSGITNLVLAAVSLLASPWCHAQLSSMDHKWELRQTTPFDHDFEAKPWSEIEAQLPPPPLAENLKSIYVSASTENRFSVDTSSISVGTDGVVRYVLVVQTPGGARNVSFEGMRCETRERRPYAFGRLDGTWSKARANEWSKIRETEVNRHYAALYLGYFCPDGVIVRNREEALGFFRTGGKDYSTGRAY